MAKPVITVENLSKAYRIGLKEDIPDSLVGVAMSWARAPSANLRKLRRLDTAGSNGDSEDTVWALRDVSFEVRKGTWSGSSAAMGRGRVPY
jgi:lipopolysaccharide transport system ATP-binding protein